MFNASNVQSGLVSVEQSSAEPDGTASMSSVAGVPWGTKLQAAPLALTKHVRGGLRPGTVRRLRSYVDEHLNERVSVEVLANIAGLSLFHFMRAFKQSMGATPHQYIVQRRIARSLDLVADTDIPLSEIALMTGFADQSHFARCFREQVGLSPRNYRLGAENATQV